MSKKILPVLTLLLFLPACATLKPAQPIPETKIQELEPFKKGERILILAPHPDDESIACAGIIQRALKSGAKVKILYLTNGEHNEPAFIVYEKRLIIKQGGFIGMGQLRRKEAVKAAEILGLKEDDLVFLGYPDFGTFEIFSRYWQVKRPYKDMLTRISSVPYPNSLSYHASYKGESILSDIEKVILDYKPDKIFSSHPADVNGDHKTFYLFLQVALSDLEGRIPAPKVYPYLVHFVGWPQSRHYHPEKGLMPPADFSRVKLFWSRADLSPEELQNKHSAILAHKSQTQTSAFYLLSFARRNELFGGYPAIRLATQILPTLQGPGSEQVGRDSALKVGSIPSEDGLVFSGSSGMFEVSKNILAEKRMIKERGEVNYALTDKFLFVRVNRPRSLSLGFGVKLTIFGYSKITPFARMPKVMIIALGKGCKAFIGGKVKGGSQIVVDIRNKTMLLKIPLVLLGYPDYILTSLKSYQGSLPVEATSFRKVLLK